MNGAGWLNSELPGDRRRLAGERSCLDRGVAVSLQVHRRHEVQVGVQRATAGGLTRIMPIPPTRWTAKLFSTRALTPRSQNTILPAAAAGQRVQLARRAGEAGVAEPATSCAGRGEPVAGRARPVVRGAVRA